MSKSIMVDGVKYVPETQLKTMAKAKKGMECSIVRTYSEGVFSGDVEKREGQEVTFSGNDKRYRCADANGYRYGIGYSTATGERYTSGIIPSDGGGNGYCNG